jgi:hypothetical protein
MARTMMVRFLLALLPAVLLAGCAGGPAVRVMADPEANFTAYRTFGFAEPLGTDRNGYHSQVSTALMAAARRELEARGLVYSSDKPDLLVNFNAALAEKMRVTRTPEPVMGAGIGFGFGPGMGYYGYRGGLYAPFPVYQDRTTVTQYKEGTLNVDVADAAARRLVWEGVVTQKVDDKAYRDLGPVIDKAVVETFARFPLKPRK